MVCSDYTELHDNQFVLTLDIFLFSGTIAQLRARKQRYKLAMFERLHRILLLAVVVILIFFGVSSFAFSGRLAEGASFRSRADTVDLINWARALQITPPNRGDIGGGFSMVGLPCCTLVPSHQSRIFGVRLRTTEDESALRYLVFLLVLTFCQYIGDVR
jgi:hypothetical protein